MPGSHDKQNVFDQVLARSLERNRQPGGPDCPDSGVIAAWFGRSLPAAQAGRVELHASSCARCQAVLAALTKTAAAGNDRVASGFSARWRWLAIGTGLSAAIALLLIWIPFKSPQQQIALNTNPPVPLKAIQPGMPIAPAGAALAPAPEKSAPAAAALSMQRMASGTLQSNSALSGSPVVAMMAARPGPIAGVTPKANRLASAAANLKSGTGPPIAASGVASGGFGGSLALMFPIRSRTGSTGWGVGRGGWILRYDSPGHAHPQTSGVSADLLAGSAPSDTVCWVVGRAGTVLRTTDGVHWQKISAPTTSDLAGVYAQSALAATVTAADGRKFVTSDGGSSWR